MRTLESILNDEIMDASDKVRLSKLILSATHAPVLSAKNETMDYIHEGYIFGKMNETITRIEEELDSLHRELKLLTTILENCNAR